MDRVRQADGQSVMRILFIVFNATGRGTFWRAFHLARELAARGHRVDLLASAPRADTPAREVQTEGVVLTEIPDLFAAMTGTGWDPVGTARRCHWARDKKYDLVHAFETRPGVILPALAARRQGARLATDWADWLGAGGSVEERPGRVLRTLLRPLETRFETRYRKAAWGTTVITTLLRERALRLGVSEGRILLLRNGSDARVKVPSRSSIRRQLGLPEDIPVVGFVGGTYPADAAFMAASFDQLSQECPQARLLLVGYFNRPIEHWVQNPQRILRTQPLKMAEVFAHLAACDLGWLPLRDCGANRARLPLKLNDYMTAGLPIVSTAVGDLGPLIQGHSMGVVTPDDPGAFAAATASLLRDAEARRTFGAAARRAAETDLSWEKLAASLEEFYNRLPPAG